MRPTTWGRSTHALIAVAVLVLVAAAVAVAAHVSGGDAPEAAAVKPAPAAATANPGIVPVSDSAPKPTPDRLAAVLAPALADPNLGKFTGRITDAITGAELWARGAEVPMQPASTNKTLTAAAALLTLDRDARLTTRVFSIDKAGVVVLKGGGDQTLSAAKPGEETWYRDAARISDLAEQVRAAGVDARSVQVDVSAYSGPTMAPGWDPADIDGGDIAPMESIMLDGGRTQPVSVDSWRTKTPALDAGRALAVALDIDPAKVTVVPGAANGGTEIASVQSPPLIDRLRDMMNASDNVMAESIGREVAAETGHPQSFAGAVQSVLGALDDAKVDTTNARLFDSSGLSVDDRLTAETLDEVVNAAAGSAEPKLRPLVELLPIAGGSGTLSNRFLDDVGRSSAGFLRAKTGSLTGTNSLAGIVTDASGRVLTFAFISNDAGPTGRIALDTFAAALRSCGCSA
ncbi:D-alanyl-D-alanine carboxypeptidase (penicillin-binding protein 4) [Mycolicibacterium rhodesiae NBB3]|uniref:D-alanyl-D-alanine carboxypeptidase (Penicillin-binding protein 4) n=1 Tax=Mycolicibacterium rhodesiae (strain NBB3) TaxID=710685 RepID=G8RRZ3_MYCRN|nr:D-alanyl-D-alanine carboxypeptidase/D-alanyl-D-alanine-endopeptidase [Mycolicibacterium rhodesiae]AEV72776.1 D-alanyl-D-alanine carboxypeptidase (penicillin-binding protein 4) [Mycolicibacterium rhodesiae NBB3]